MNRRLLIYFGLVLLLVGLVTSCGGGERGGTLSYPPPATIFPAYPAQTPAYTQPRLTPHVDYTSLPICPPNYILNARKATPSPGEPMDKPPTCRLVPTILDCGPDEICGPRPAPLGSRYTITPTIHRDP